MASKEELERALAQADEFCHEREAAMLREAVTERDQLRQSVKELERQLAASEAACAQMRTALTKVEESVDISCFGDEAVIDAVDDVLALTPSAAYERVQKQAGLLKDAVNENYARHALGCSGDLGYPCKCGFAEWQARYREWEANDAT